MLLEAQGLLKLLFDFKYIRLVLDLQRLSFLLLLFKLVPELDIGLVYAFYYILLALKVLA